MSIPRDIGKPPNPDDGSCLYQMPEEFRDHCEAAVRAGYARSAEEFWYYEQRPDRPNLVFVRSLLAAILRAAPNDNSDSRNEAQRLDDAMKALFGRVAVSGSNKKDDAQLLQDMAWEVEMTGADHRDFRGIAQRLLEGRNLGAATMESSVRRLVSKFDNDRNEAAAAARGFDPMPESLELLALEKIKAMLHSVGVPTNNERMSM